MTDKFDEYDEESPAEQTKVPAMTLSVLGRGLKKAKGKHPDPPPEKLAEGTVRKPKGARRGDVIGDRYLIEGTIGRGGMGRVLSARHQLLGKHFALKLIKNVMADDARIRDMFYREGRLLSGLTHENICSIVDFGEDASFGLFMVMELLDGTSLHAKLMHAGRFAPKVACDVMRQIADALRYIHERDIIHGDIKSENILLTRTSDRRRVVKLLDFGLARAAKGEGSRHLEGTPEYLAPERIQGQPASVKSDIYALGILFYELLTGSVPFKGDVKQVFGMHTDTPMPLPSQKVGSHLDERADELIAKATAKNPADRHDDVAAFLYELRTLMTMMGFRKRSLAAHEGLAGVAAPQLRAAAEIFELAPLPLASVNSRGELVAANRAFLEFLGLSKFEPKPLAETGMAKVYPQLREDLSRALRGKGCKRVLELREGGETAVEVAVTLTAPAMNQLVASGEIHIALHPLARIRLGDEAEKSSPSQDEQDESSRDE